jgi:hypothetical protein
MLDIINDQQGCFVSQKTAQLLARRPFAGKAQTDCQAGLGGHTRQLFRVGRNCLERDEPDAIAESFSFAQP